MAKLYRLDKSGELVGIDEKQFQDEVNEMEPFIKKNPEIIGDFIIFGEQVISSGRDNRIDLLAVDRDGNIFIIELKRDYVGKEELGKILGYRLFWKKSPDAVKNLWNDYKNKPSDINPDWDNFDPRIVLVASSISEELIEIVGMEGLPVDFIEFSRFEHGETTFVIVERRETTPLKAGPVMGQKEWNWDWYLKSKAAEPKQIEMAKHVYNQILTFSEKKGWNITPKFNKWYISFKCGHFNCCWLEFRHRDKVSLCVNIKDEEDDPSKISEVKWLWDKNWKFWYLETNDSKFDIEQIINVLDKAYKNAIGL